MKLLIIFFLLSIHVLAINRLRSLNHFRFDDPKILEKTQEIWSKISTPSLEKGYATSINNLFGEVKVLVKAEISKSTGDDKTNLEKEWDEFTTQYNAAAESFNTIRESMRKIEAEKSAQTSQEDDNAFDAGKTQLQNEIAELVKKVEANASADKSKLLKNAAIRGLAASMPPSFCWKKPDFGKIPTDCPADYPDRSGALCYRNCENIKGEHGYKGDKAKYHFKIWGGVCWEDCETFEGTSGQWESKGLVCNKKAAKGWHWKRSFVTSSKTNFNSGVTCPKDMYKGLALCYRDCAKIGYKNCGIGACSIYKSTCYKEVARMVWKTFTGVLKFVGFVLSLGTSSAVSAAIESIQEVVDKIEIGVKVFEGLEIAKTVFKNPTITGVVKTGCIQKTKELLKAYASVKESEIQAACAAAIEEEKARQAKPEVSFDPTTVFLDTLEEAKTGSTYSIASGVVGILKECDWRKKEESSFKTSCARAVLEGFSGEPTGLVGLAAAFIYERCPQGL